MGWLSKPTTFNILQLGFAFLFNFIAFNGAAYIEQAVVNSQSDAGSISKHAGYYSLALIYGSLTLSNLISAPIVEIMKPKWAMAIGTLTYALFEVGFLCLNEIFLYSTSLLLGFGAAILWTGQGTYLAQNCEPNDSSRNSAVLCMMGQLSSLFSGIFLLIVFQSAESKHDILPSTIRILYGTFTGLSILATLIIVFQRTPPYEDRGRKDARNYKELLGVFPTCISSTTKLNYNTNALMAWSSIFSGIGQLIAGAVQGKLGNKIQQFGRENAILLGTISQVLAYALSYANFPNDSANMKTEKLGNLLYPNITIAMIISVLLGIGDSIWNAQIYSVLIDTYPDKSSEAFAVRVFYKSAMTCGAFFYTPSLQLHWQLLILTVSAVIGTIFFVMFEKMAKREDKVSITPSSYNESSKKLESNTSFQE